MLPIAALGRQVARRVLASAGLRISRQPENRFDAMGETLAALAASGFAPAIVIDGGANVGQWATTAHAVFPDAIFHLVEPQPACRPALEQLGIPRLTVHGVALTAPGYGSVRMIGAGEDRVGTGAYVSDDPTPDGAAAYPATTLDALFADVVGPDDRVLLKLDLEGHERSAIEGGVALLQRVEVVVLEVGFFDVERAGHPMFPEMLALMARHGFSLYDVAMLSARPRDGRLRIGDVVFVRDGSPLATDTGWA